MNNRLLFILICLLLTRPVLGEGLVFSSGEAQVTLLELYTSQGCSSCPPAERWLNRLTETDNLWQAVVPVAFHVDYWDYLGWRDPYASPAYSQRQRDYARAGLARTVYTPGLFANGEEWRGWPRRRQPPASGRQPGRLEVQVQGDELQASFAVTDQPLQLHVAVLGFGIDTRVLRGENRDRTLRQEFVVLAHTNASSSNGRWRLQLPRYDENSATRFGLAVWVSDSAGLTPLQATGGWLH